MVKSRILTIAIAIIITVSSTLLSFLTTIIKCNKLSRTNHNIYLNKGLAEFKVEFKKDTPQDFKAPSAETVSQDQGTKIDKHGDGETNCDAFKQSDKVSDTKITSPQEYYKDESPEDFEMPEIIPGSGR
jgi:hypothetical protein